MKTRTGALLDLSIIVLFTIAFTALSLSINFVDRLYAFFVASLSPSTLKLLINTAFLFLCGLLFGTYRRWREAVKQKRELERIISAINPDVLLVVDADRNIVMCNESVKGVFGYDADQVVGQKTELLYFDNRAEPGRQREVYEAWEKKGFHIESATGKNKGGGHVPLEIVSGKLTGSESAVLLLRDITERKQAEEALKESERRYKALFEGAAEGILVVDTETQSIRYANRAMCDILGYGKDEISRLIVADIHPKDSLLHAGAESEAQGCGEKRLASNIPCQREDGSVFYADICTVEMELDGRRCSVEFFTDVTERREFEARLDAERIEREKMELELRHAQKLEAVGQLAAGIAHEINTPVQFVGDSVHFLKEAFEDLRELIVKYRKAVLDLGCAPGHEKVLEEIKAIEERVELEYLDEQVPGSFDTCSEGVSRISSIVRSMKEFAHPDSRQKSFADLNTAVLNTLTISRNEYKYVAEVKTDLGEIPQVMCHVGDLNQVFLNIIINAAHAIADVVGDSGDKGLIRARTALEGDFVRIEFEDTGSGIPAAIRDRIFDPFFTTKEVGRGSGQGLAIARSIVTQKHNGSLTCDSKEGRGTTFTIHLPIDAKNRG